MEYEVAHECLEVRLYDRSLGLVHDTITAVGDAPIRKDPLVGSAACDTKAGLSEHDALAILALESHQLVLGVIDLPLPHSWILALEAGDLMRN